MRKNQLMAYEQSVMQECACTAAIKRGVHCT